MSQKPHSMQRADEWYPEPRSNLSSRQDNVAVLQKPSSLVFTGQNATEVDVQVWFSVLVPEDRCIHVFVLRCYIFSQNCVVIPAACV